MDETQGGTVTLTEMMDLVAERKAQRMLAGNALPADLLAEIRQDDAEIARLKAHMEGLLNGWRHAVGIFEREVTIDLAAGTYEVAPLPDEAQGDE